MHIILKHLFIFIFAIVSMVANAQLFTATALPTQNQLPVANIHCILQDEEGYMWYGTTGGGLCRDNGYQIDVFSSYNVNSSAMMDNNISCLAEDARHGICVGTSHGLFRIDKTDYHVEKLLQDSYGNSKIKVLMSDSKGFLWVGIDELVLKLSKQGSLLKTYPITWNGIPKPVSCFAEDDNGNILVGMWQGGISRYDEKSDKFVPCSWNYNYSPVKIVAKGNDVFVATWGGGIVGYDMKTGNLSVQSSSMGNTYKQQILDFYCDSRQGLYWVTTMNDFFVYQNNNGSLVPLALNKILPSYGKILDHIEEDRDGNIWVAGFMPRTFILSANVDNTQRYEVDNIKSLTHYPLLADRVVADGRYYWIWQGRYGLTLYEAATEKVVDARGDRFERCIEKDKVSSGIYAAEDNKLFKLTVDNGVVKYTKLATFDKKITCIKSTANRQIFVGTKNSVYRYGELGGNIVKIASYGSPVVDMVVSANDTPYYIIEGKGIYANGKLLSEGTAFSALALSEDATLWISTKYGDVMCYKNGHLEKDYLASDDNKGSIKCMDVDNMGHLWVLTDQRIKEYNPKTKSLRVIRAEEPFVDVNYFYHLRPMDGDKMIVAGAGAFCLLSSSSALNRVSGVGHVPVVTSVTMGDSLYYVGMGAKEFKIPADVSSITLRLSTFEHLYSSRITYAYKLKDSNVDWTYLPQGVNVIHLGNLPTGNNVLMVKATDIYGCWGSETECLQLYHQKYWWATWWARLLFLVIGFVLAYYIYVLGKRIKSLHQLQQKRKEIVLTEIEIHPEELDAAKIDKEFLQQAVDVVERNILECDYSVEQFSKDMCMSRMNLYRKVQTLTGLTPSEFIRDIKLKKAAQILKSTPNASINEVATKVGFATPSYFSKCFKQKFGMLPSVYAKSDTKK